MSLLSVQGVGKAYRSYSSEWARVSGWFGWRTTPVREHWVLRNVSFGVQQGESIGIIGRNGAGKSTLLKIIARTLVPSEGVIETTGNVAAILELGMGFNRELSGRSNVVHAAGLMGIDVKDFSTLIPEVMEFSELGEYFDKPLRTYSSGMSARLAFALATARRPDLLIVDEALSVGDDAFRRKCFSRIESYVAQGTSLLLVSHFPEQIRRICSRAIYLDKNQVIADGLPKDVCAIYEKDLLSGFVQHKNGMLAGSDASESKAVDYVRYLDLKAQVLAVALKNKAGEEVNMIPAGPSIRIVIKAMCHEAHMKLALSIGIKTPDGVRVYAATFKDLKVDLGTAVEKPITKVVKLNAHLLPGIYFLTVGLFDASGDPIKLIHQVVDEVMFQVYQADPDINKTELGIAALNALLEEEVGDD